MYGAGNKDFLLFTYIEGQQICSNLVTHDVAIQVRDITSHPDLIFQDFTYTENLSYGSTVPYNAVTPSETDVISQVSMFDGSEICTLAE